MLPVAIFVRISGKSQDYERQVNDLTSYATKQSYQVVDAISEVISASKTKAESRQSLTKLMDLARAGKIKKVLVSEVSRLGRRTSDVLKIIEELTELGVSVYAHNYGLETLTKDNKRNPVASLLFTLLAEFARMETETLSERIRSGQAEALRKGRKIGRKKGSTEDPAALLKKYPGVVKDVKAGLSIRKIAAIREVSPATVQKIKGFLK